MLDRESSADAAMCMYVSEVIRLDSHTHVSLARAAARGPRQLKCGEGSLRHHLRLRAYLSPLL